MTNLAEALLSRIHGAGHYLYFALGFLVLIAGGSFLLARWLKKSAPENVRDVVTSGLVLVVALGTFKVFPFAVAIIAALILLSCHAASILKRRGILPHAE